LHPLYGEPRRLAGPGDGRRGRSDLRPGFVKTSQFSGDPRAGTGPVTARRPRARPFALYSFGYHCPWQSARMEAVPGAPAPPVLARGVGPATGAGGREAADATILLPMLASPRILRRSAALLRLLRPSARRRRPDRDGAGPGVVGDAGGRRGA